MQIGTNYTPLPIFGTMTSAAGGTANSAAKRTSLFGPASMVTLGGGFSFYGGSPVVNGPLVPQFDLAATMAGQTSGIPALVRSEEQIKAEEEAVKQALTFIDEGKYDAARTLMNNLLDENPTNSAAVHALGYTELSDENYEKAEQLFLKAHALNPTVGYDNDANNARILQQGDDEVLARVRGLLKTPSQRGEAIRLLIALTERSPENVPGKILLGDALLDEGDGSNGLLQFNNAIREANSAELIQLEKRLSDMVKEAPGGAFVRQLLGKTQLRREHYSDALQTLKTASELSGHMPAYDGDLAKAYVGIGRERLERGDLSGAMTSFEQARQLTSASQEVKDAIAEAYLVRAEKHTQRRDYGSALGDYRKAADLMGDGTDKSLRQRGAAGAYSVGLKIERDRIADGGEINAEASAFQTAYDLDPDSSKYKHKLAETRYALGDQYTAAEDYEAAAHSYQRALRLYEHNDTYQDATINAFVAYGDERLAALNYDDAVAAYLEAFKVDQLDLDTKRKLADAYTARAFDHTEWQRWSQVVADFKTALQLFPDDPTYQANWDEYAMYDV